MLAAGSRGRLNAAAAEALASTTTTVRLNFAIWLNQRREIIHF
jgi:hypothetical protein